VKSIRNRNSCIQSPKSKLVSDIRRNFSHSFTMNLRSDGKTTKLNSAMNSAKLSNLTKSLPIKAMTK
jgi:hypothetical protein